MISQEKIKVMNDFMGAAPDGCGLLWSSGQLGFGLQNSYELQFSGLSGFGTVGKGSWSAVMSDINTKYWTVAMSWALCCVLHAFSLYLCNHPGE